MGFGFGVSFPCPSVGCSVAGEMFGKLEGVSGTVSLELELVICIFIYFF